MVDLSDIIGEAVGGATGKQIDELIDKLRMYYKSLGINFDDVDIVRNALVYYVVNRPSELTFPSEIELQDAIDEINRLIKYEMR